MARKQQQIKAELVETKDLGNGRMQATFRVGPYSPETIEELAKASERASEMLYGAASTVFNRYDPSFYNPISSYSSFTYPYSVTKIPKDRKEQIRFAIEVSQTDPVVGTVIDLLTDLASSGFDIETDDEKVLEFFKEYNEITGMDARVKEILYDYFRICDVFVYRDTTPEGYDAYTVLNPLAVEVSGSLFVGQEEYLLDISSVWNELSQLDPQVKESFLKTLPSPIRRKIRSGESKIPLPKERVSRISRKKMPYERYATPWLMRVYEPIMFKRRLRQMDLSTAEGLINQLVTVTIGSDEHPATDRDLQNLAKLFTTPKSSWVLFWNHTLKVEFHSPKGIETLNKDKYEQVNEDILMGLGIPRVVIDGEGGNYSTAFVSVMSLLERLKYARRDVTNWLENEYRRVAKENGLKSAPRVRFNDTILRVENFVRQVLIPLYERGLISRETILDQVGFDIRTEIQRKEKEQEFEDLFVPPTLPYSRNPGRPPGSKDKEPRNAPDTVETPDGGPSGAPADPKQAAKAQLTEEEIEQIVRSYEQKLSFVYDDLLTETLNIVNAELDTPVKQEQIALAYEAFLMTAFDETWPLMMYVYNKAYTDYAQVSDEYFNNGLDKLQRWHRSHLQGFVSDLQNQVSEFVHGRSEKATIDEIFDSERYRVKFFAENSIIEARRHGELAGLQAAKVSQVRWRAVLDERTCAYCLNLHGKIFSVNAVPHRPHANCRCGLEPVE
ncbi:MAG: phage minor head protein [Clostridia bacterium]